MLRFDWDENKNRSNRSKHGIWFEEARSVFDDTSSRVFMDAEHSDDQEERFVIIGMSSVARLLVVVHCCREKDAVIRIISARKATKREEKFYEKGRI